MSTAPAFPAHEALVAVVEAYIDGFARGDVDAVLALFADDATIEDPYGGPAVTGRASIEAFYKAGIASGARLALDGPVRSAADVAAFAFTVTVPAPDGTMRIEVIETFQIDASGRIRAMRAYWSQANVHTGRA